MYEKILVPLDGSNLAEAVLPDVERLAWDPATKVVLLTVELKGPVGTRPPGGSVDGRGTSTMERVASEHGVYLAAVAERLANKGVTVETAVVNGHVAEEILAYAKSHGCDLIAMSTHGRSGMKRGLIGSVTDEVVQGAEAPVLAGSPYVREGKHLDGGIKRIAVPLDGSPLAEEVLPHVESLAEEMSLEVMLLRVVRLTPSV